jgi:excisionase family DNA binding protein
MKDLYTTGEVADICRVSQQTIIRCFDNGKLEGFRIPGSKFRRIPRKSLIKFMKANDIPLESMDMGRRKVLVVDDDPEIVELLVDVLEKDERFEVRTATSGYEAGIVTHQFRPDVILLDYMLPDVNGNVVCHTIKQNREFENTKVIIVSGVIKPDEIDMLMQAGAEDFIKKPFDIDELLERICDVLQMEEAG